MDCEERFSGAGDVMCMDDYPYTDSEDLESEEFEDSLLDFAKIEEDANPLMAGNPPQKHYTGLNEEDIRRFQEDDIDRVLSAIDVSRTEASILLRHYCWNVSKIHEEWSADEERVRRTVGIFNTPTVPSCTDTNATCGICFEYPMESASTYCGHSYCTACWKGYVRVSIDAGPSCLMLRCPYPCCAAAVGQDLIDRVASEEDKKKYARYFFRSYIEDNPLVGWKILNIMTRHWSSFLYTKHKWNFRNYFPMLSVLSFVINDPSNAPSKMTWCPYPGCEYAISCTDYSGNNDVSCLCSYSFCLKCGEEAHRPVDCETVVEWFSMMAADSHNQKWIIANTKPCPECKRPIQKSFGCMHMTCGPPCHFQFCWLCLRAWSNHEAGTGGNFQCVWYVTEQMNGLSDESGNKRKMARLSLRKYTRYYERWANQQYLRRKAIEYLQALQEKQLERLSSLQCRPRSELTFVLEAWQQVIECRRVLKWIYVYGYYFPPHENAKRQFFDFLQGQGEDIFERLYHCASKELQKFMNKNDPSNDFGYFKRKLGCLTSAAKDYFEKWVNALNNGLVTNEAGGGSAEMELSPPKNSEAASSSRDMKGCDRMMFSLTGPGPRDR